MLEEILNHIHNFFVVRNGVHRGRYTISSNTISLDFLQEGQYFRIVGSIFNDGVYKYPTNKLNDEIFDGEIWALAIPNSLISIAKEIEDWVEAYGGIVQSPYQSESFGGYSYTKSTSSSSSETTDWRIMFKDRLNVWRKLS